LTDLPAFHSPRAGADGLLFLIDAHRDPAIENKFRAPTLAALAFLVLASR
jgi:hypothetical protein